MKGGLCDFESRLNLTMHCSSEQTEGAPCYIGGRKRRRTGHGDQFSFFNSSVMCRKVFGLL